MEPLLGSDWKGSYLIDGWNEAEAHVGEAITLKAAVQVGGGDVMAEVASNAGRAQRGPRSGRRRTAGFRGQNLLA